MIEVTMEDFARAANNLADRERNFQFFNSNSECASIVIANLFSHAKDKVVVYGDMLDDDLVSDMTVNAVMKRFFSTGKQLTVIARKESDIDNEALKKINAMQEQTKGSLNIQVATAGFNSDLSLKAAELLQCPIDTQKVSFLITDRNGFRIGRSDTDSEGVRRAFANFRNRKLVSGMNDIVQIHYGKKAALKQPFWSW